jgi:hypothetical protein
MLSEILTAVGFLGVIMKKARFSVRIRLIITLKKSQRAKRIKH